MTIAVNRNLSNCENSPKKSFFRGFNGASYLASLGETCHSSPRTSNASRSSRSKVAPRSFPREARNCPSLCIRSRTSTAPTNADRVNHEDACSRCNRRANDWVSWVNGRRPPSRKTKVFGRRLREPSNPTERCSRPLSPYSSTLIDVVENRPVGINLQQVFKLSVDDDTYSDSGSRPKFKDQLQISSLLGVQHVAIGTTVGHIVKHEQGTILVLPPIVLSHHAALFLAPSPADLQKVKVACQVFVTAVVNEN